MNNCRRLCLTVLHKYLKCCSFQRLKPLLWHLAGKIFGNVLIVDSEIVDPLYFMNSVDWLKTGHVVRSSSLKFDWTMSIPSTISPCTVDKVEDWGLTSIKQQKATELPIMDLPIILQKRLLICRYKYTAARTNYFNFTELFKVVNNNQLAYIINQWQPLHCGDQNSNYDQNNDKVYATTSFNSYFQRVLD